MRMSFQYTNKQLKYFHSEHSLRSVLRVDVTVFFNVALQNVFLQS